MARASPLCQPPGRGRYKAGNRSGHSKIALGELGRDGKLEDDELGLRAYTYMTLADTVLAEREDAEIKREVQDLLAKTTRKPDITALEVALALLGDAKHLKPEHLDADSPVVDGALRAIERFNGREGMDILVEAGLDSPDGHIQEKSLLLFERMVDQNWYSKDRNGGLAQFAEDDQELSGFIKDAKKWWREHGPEFVARRRAKMTPGIQGGKCARVIPLPVRGRRRRSESPDRRGE